jgi:hypothetical protein
MKRNVTYLSAAVRTCTDPQLGPKLAALGYTHVVVRRDDRASPLAGTPAGLALVATFPDSQVYFVSAEIPPVVTLRTAGFYDYEHDGGDWWRWMEAEGRFTVKNTTRETQRVALAAVLESVGEPRVMTMTIDGAAAGAVDVRGPLREYTLGPWSLTPGEHTLSFLPSGVPFKPSAHGASDDERDLTISFRNPRWIAR